MAKDKTAFTWLFEKSKKELCKIFLLSLLGIAMSYLSVRFAFASKTVIDVATGALDMPLSQPVITLVFLMLSQIFIHIVYTVVEVRVSVRLFHSIQHDSFSSVLNGDYRKVTDVHSGELVNRLTSDASMISDGIMTIVPQFFTTATQLLLSLGALFFIDKDLAVVCIIVFPLVSVATRLYGKKIKPLHKKCQHTSGVVKSYMQESIQNILAIKTFVKESFSSSRLRKYQDDNFKVSVKRGIITILANLLFFVIMTFGYYLALIWCSYKISLGIMTVGTLMAVLQLVDQLQTPFKEFSSIISGYYSASASAERIMELENMEEEKTTYINRDFSSLVFKDVDFSYNDEYILKDANVRINKGDTVAVVGNSGAGKSTMMLLLMGVVKPDKGQVYEENVVENLMCTPSKELFAYVPQGNMIFSGTIKENIAFSCGDIDYERLEKASKDACIYDYVMSLADGFDTLLGEGGLGLSEGQIQRLALARAFYSSRPVILLDEATSALDEDTEKAVLSNIKNMDDKTCIIITHRQNTRDVCDRILHIINSSICE